MASTDREPIEQLAEEWRERWRRGEVFTADEYIARHPDLVNDIRELFPAIELMEQLKPPPGDLTGAATVAPSPLPVAGERLDRLGEYRILREIGRGGMGVVYEAEQESLGRRVALKVLPAGVAQRASYLERFRREARAAAKLHHTNIVPVFGVGEENGTCYYAMQYIQGQPLDVVLEEVKRLRGVPGNAASGPLACSVAESLLADRFPEAEPAAADGPAPPPTPRSAISAHVGSSYYRRVALLGLQTAEGLAHAHGQGILHRDIKPSNLLLDLHGTVWITDFGLAKAEDSANLTQSGDIVGTLRYMAPERFEGKADARSDIYAVGLTLYELLALRPAFEGTDRASLIGRITSETPAPLRLRVPDVPRDLETIVLKAMAREPAARYASAADLAEDLRRFLENRPIKARRISTVERLRRWCRRNPTQASLAASVLALLIVIAAGASLTAVHFQQLADKETAAHQRAQEAFLTADAARAGEARQREAAEEARKNEAIEREKATAAKKHAEADFHEARQAVEQLVTRVSEGRLKKLPGTQLVRRELLESALTYYQGFVDRHGDDPALKGDLADACTRLAGILAQLGSVREALKVQQQAEHLLSDLRRLRPKDKKLALDLVAHYRAVAGLQRRMHDRDAAMASLGKAYDTLLEMSPQDPPRYTTVKILQAMTHGNVRVHESSDWTIMQTFADVLNDKGLTVQAQNQAEAIHSYMQALYIRQRLVDNVRISGANPVRAALEHELARQWSLVGGPYAEQQMHVSAMQYQVQAYSLLEHLVRAYPEYARRADILRDIAAVKETLGGLCAATDQIQQSLPWYREALAYREHQAADNPAVADFQRELTDCLFNLAKVQAHDGRPVEAIQSLQRAIERQRTLVAAAPEEKPYLRALARQYLALARVERQHGVAPAASYRQALAAMDQLTIGPACATLVAIPGPIPPLVFADLRQGGSEDFLMLAAVLAGRGDAEAAMAALRRAHDAGLADGESLPLLAEFAGLRGRGDFQAILQSIKAKTHVLDWLTDFDEARAKAERENKDLFLYFGSSDSEPTGVWFQRNMLTHPLVSRSLNKHFICVDLDRPHFPPRPRNIARTYQLTGRWGAAYLATMVLTDSKGRAYWREIKGSSEIGRWNSPEEFVAALDAAHKKREERDLRLAEAEKQSSDLRKAGDLERAIQNVTVYAAFDYQDIYARICRLDHDNRLGLRTKYIGHRLASGRAAVRTHLQQGHWQEALAECNSVLEELTAAGSAGVQELTAPGNAAQALFSDRGNAYQSLFQVERAAVNFGRARPSAAPKVPKQALADLAKALAAKSDDLAKARQRFGASAKSFSDRLAADDACCEVALLQNSLARPADAAETLAYLGHVWQGKAGWLYIAARDIAALMHDGAVSGDARHRMADLSIALLQQALAAGYVDAERTMRDATFRRLRERADFRAQCNEMALRGTFALATEATLPANEEQTAAALVARNLAAAYDWDRAEACYRTAVDDKPDDTQLRLDRARFLGRRGKWREAIADYDRVLERQGDKPMPWHERGRCHAMLQQWERTAADFLKALELSPPDIGISSAGSHLCKELAQWPAALDAAVAMRPAESRLLVGRARFHYLRGQWREAADAFAKSIEYHPLGEEWFEAAATYALAGDQEAQRKLVAELIRRAGPQPSPSIAFVLARACATMADPPAKAKQIVLWAQQLHNQRFNDNWVVHGYGAALYRAGDLDAAVNSLSRSIAIGWNNELNHYLLAMAHHHRGDAGQARQALDRAREQFDSDRPTVPGEPARLAGTDWLEANLVGRDAEAILNAPHRREADRAVQQQRWGEAITHLDELIRKDPSFWPDWPRRGDAHARLGHWKEAAADYARLIELRPQEPMYWFERACLLCQLDDLAAYRALCTQIDDRFGHRLAQGDVVFRAHSYALAPGALGDAAAVVNQAKERLARTKPPSIDNAFSIHVLALGYYRASQYDAAVECLSKDPTPKEYEVVGVLNWLVLAMAEEKRGRPDVARKWFSQAERWIVDTTGRLPPGGPVVPANIPWRDWLLVQLLHREARRVLVR
jgi:serine/threonine-protein kinase